MMRRSVAVATFVALSATIATARAEQSTGCDQVQLQSLASAEMSDAVWTALPAWSAKLRFQIDRSTGAPRAAVVIELGQKYRNAADRFEDEESLRRIALETVSRFRFCTPSNYNGQSQWTATLRFMPVRAKGLYVQLFEPAYSRDEVRDGRRGNVKVRTVFGIDGRVSTADVIASSGDAVLDQKALQSVMNDRLIAARGLPLDRPVVFELPFIFQIQ